MVEAVKIPKVAVMVLVPWLTLVVIPEEPIVAIEVVDELQTTCVVKLIVLPSAKFALAENWELKPMGKERFWGEIETDTSADWVTVRFVEDVIRPEVAATAVAPGASAVRMPPAPIAATWEYDEVQLTAVVISAVLPSV